MIDIDRLRQIIYSNSITGTNTEIRDWLNEKRYPAPSFTSEQIYALAEQLIVAGTANENNAFIKATRKLAEPLSLIELNFAKGDSVTSQQVGDAVSTITENSLRNDAINALNLLMNEILTTKFNNRNAIRNRFSQLLP